MLSLLVSLHLCLVRLIFHTLMFNEALLHIAQRLVRNDEYVVEYQCNLQQVLGTVILEVVQV